MERVVYSTEHGRLCPDCAKPSSACACRQKKPLPATGAKIRVSRETKGRKGKRVTLIKGLALNAVSLAQMGKTLKAACGSGGTVKNGVIEIQGDHIERVLNYLKKQGLSAKRAGG